MTRKEELEMIAEKKVAEMLNSSFKKINERYESMIKENVENEMDRANDAIKADNPDYGAIVINLDGCELSFPYTGDTTVEIDNGSKCFTFKVDENLRVEELIATMIEDMDIKPFVKVTTKTNKELEFYNKDKLINENEKIKITKTYTKTFEGIYPKSKICAVYRLNGSMSD